MEARAKQRLTGAIILVALFVLLVPELLTGPRDSHPAADNPNDDGLHRYTIDLDTHNAASSPPTTVPDQSAVALPAVPQSPNSAPATTDESAAPENASPKAPATSVTTPTNPAVSSVPPNHAAAISPTAAAPTTSTASRTESARPPLTESSAKLSATSGSFAVQLGTFGKRENADRLVRDMTAKGFSAFVVPTNTNGHELFRVRVGPARDRAAAEALAAQLKRAGQPGSIVPIS